MAIERKGMVQAAASRTPNALPTLGRFRRGLDFGPMIYPSATNGEAPVGGRSSETASMCKGRADSPSQPALHPRRCAQEGRTTWQDDVPALITSSQERTMALLKLRDGTELYYKDWGSGKPILFSHGWPLSADMWDAQMLFLAERGYRTVAFDRRGFGRSSQPWTGYD